MKKAKWSQLQKSSNVTLKSNDLEYQVAYGVAKLAKS